MGYLLRPWLVLMESIAPAPAPAVLAGAPDAEAFGAVVREAGGDTEAPIRRLGGGTAGELQA
jgi:hypothetical protein